eukprot:TRINITY_DN17014_c0_g1_i1.p1 TRINITY_DN17014_c0_g1~~TRINITY_DN17014_c0_g1_i1.p1  ORF type:complete len:722 (-),score=93.53 TRINITY_DN17014_c0_g1_i1:72-2237(-)
MKFGKVAFYNLNPDWSPYFLNYKALKKAIAAEKRFRTAKGDAQALLPRERDLFDTLFQVEVKKVDTFYRTEESKLHSRFKTMKVSEQGMADSDEEDVTFGKTVTFGAEFGKACFEYCCGRTTRIPLTKREMLSLFRDLDSLKNFAQLNYLAIKKILRKYDRVFDSRQAEKRLKDISSLHFPHFNILMDNMKDIELLFAECFTSGNISKAGKFLRPNKLSYHTLFSGGVLVGMNVALAFLFIFLYSLVTTQADIRTQALRNVLPVFRATGLPIVFVWVWALLIIAWQRHGINYVYILQLNPTTISSYLDIIKMASTFSLLWLVCFVSFLAQEEDFFTNYFGWGDLPSSVFPLIMLVIMIVLFFCPLNFFYRHTRAGLIYSLLNIFIAPFGRLYFRDFFLADILTSLPSALVDLFYTSCFFLTGQFLPSNSSHVTFEGECSRYNKLYFATIVSFLPYWWRFMQCFNKYYHTRNAFPHLVNAGKYFSGLVVVGFQVAHALGDPSAESNVFTTLQIFFVVSRIINALYSWIWDVTMDWGLFRSRKKPFLRRTLLCSRIWLYYVIIIGDIVLRFFWVLSLYNYLFMNGDYWNPISALVEIFRRSVWSFFRVELEALENYEEYRTIDIRVPKLLKERKQKENESRVPLTERKEERSLKSVLVQPSQDDSAVPIPFSSLTEDEELSTKSRFSTSHNDFVRSAKSQIRYQKAHLSDDKFQFVYKSKSFK